MNDSLAFPAPEAGDPEDVTWTLQTAGTMWARGDTHEAVRWLRRAAEAAGDAGNDMRAVTLARAAADLTNALALPPSAIPPAVAVGTSPDQTTRMQRPPVSRPDNAAITPIEDSERTDTEFTIPNGMAAVDAPKRLPLPPPRNRPPPSPTPPPLTPPPRSSPSAAAPPPPSRRSNAPPSSLASTVPMSRRSAPPALRPASEAPPPSRPSRSSPVVEHTPSPPPAEPASRTSRTSVSPGAGLPAVRPRQALRVAVTPAPDDRNLLLVRPLGDDEALPEGCHEALLTAMEPGAHLLTKKR